MRSQLGLLGFEPYLLYLNTGYSIEQAVSYGFEVLNVSLQPFDALLESPILFLKLGDVLLLQAQVFISNIDLSLVALLRSPECVIESHSTGPSGVF